MSENNFRDVGTFHHKFELDHVTCENISTGSTFGGQNATYPNSPKAGPRDLDLHPHHSALIRFRLKFLEEELTEISEGAFERDHAKVFDGLLDLVYVALGTAHLLGYPWQEGWDEVQRANMTKERCVREEDSKRGSTFDVIKPGGWRPPDIAGILRRHGWNV